MKIVDKPVTDAELEKLMNRVSFWNIVRWIAMGVWILSVGWATWRTWLHVMTMRDMIICINFGLLYAMCWLAHLSARFLLLANVCKSEMERRLA